MLGKDSEVPQPDGKTLREREKVCVCVFVCGRCMPRSMVVVRKHVSNLVLLSHQQEDELRATKELMEQSTSPEERKNLMNTLHDKLQKLELPGQVAAQQKVRFCDTSTRSPHLLLLPFLGCSMVVNTLHVSKQTCC